MIDGLFRGIWQPILLLAGLALDGLTLRCQIRKCRHGAGSSGAGPFPWAFYAAAVLPSLMFWPVRIALFLALIGLNLFCQSIGPCLYSGLLNGRTALHRAVVWGNSDRLKRLLEKGLDPNAADIPRWTPLHIAVRYESDAMTRILLEHGADPDSRTDYGSTPLHHAVLDCSVGSARALLEAGASIDLKNEAGETPLHISGFKGSEEMTALLLEHGADPGAKDQLGRTAEGVARFCGNNAVAELLSRKPD